MRILSMTATFGKLENKTLTLKPGLNVISAPNEWGKSTWCAFLVAMLYGIDTRERTTLTTLADKERYQPWSGSPMSGRIELLWQDRRITLERSPKGRIPMGEFKAYETATGLPVPELTGENCGQALLGVEKSVFVRSGFVRLADMPVTNDESLRRRLNALVTTGDESGASDALAQKLKDLKNSVRYNKTGLLPAAESQRSELLQRIGRLETLEQQSLSIREEQAQVESQLLDLENHKLALEYEKARESLRRLEAAQQARDEAEQAMKEAQAHCQALPSEETARDTLGKLNDLQQQWNLFQAEPQPIPPEPVQTPAPFAGLTGDQAVRQATDDHSALTMLSKPLSPALLILAGVFALGGIGLMLVQWYLLFAGLVPAAVFFLAHSRSKAAQTRDREAVCSRYGALQPELWVAVAQKYQTDAQAYENALDTYKKQASALQERRETLTRQTDLLTQGQPLAAGVTGWEKILSDHEACRTATQKWKQADAYAQTMKEVVKPATPPVRPDQLTLTAAQTEEALQSATLEKAQLTQRLGQCEGQMQSLGQKQTLQSQLSTLQQRIDSLEEVFAAVTVAQNTLAETAAALQRRFAPVITKSARELFARFTGGRYDRLTLGRDLAVDVGAQTETTLRGSIWRSDGTADQLYLALRLAVARELTPQGPLVLDDALARFDDTRLGVTLDVLCEEAQQKQVILFTCQNREETYLSGKE